MLTAMLIATLLASAAAIMLIDTRAARGASSETLRLARAQSAAQKLLAVAQVRLDSGDPLPAQGLLFEGPSGRVLRQDAPGLVDVNAAPPERIAALFVSFGASPDEASALGDAIADWRDSDNLRRLHGAEAEDYERAGLEPPANRAFVTETELARVLGMRPELLACALPYLTIYAGADIDANAAPADLRARLGLSDGISTSPAALGNVVIVRAEAALSAHAVFERTLWLRLTGDPAKPVMIHRAQEGFSPLAQTLPACSIGARAP